MDYEKKYKEALERAKKLYDSSEYMCEKDSYATIFPELKKIEDERIRKELLSYLDERIDIEGRTDTSVNLEWIAWLEKQGEQKPVITEDKDAEKTAEEYRNFRMSCGIKDPVMLNEIEEAYYEGAIRQQKPTDKVEPKFKVGDWVTNSIETVQITGYDIDYGYQVDYKGNLLHRDTDIIEKEYHLWTIEDARDGNVLSYVTDEEDLWIMIYWSLYESYEGHVHYHALLVNDNFSDKGTCCICIDDLKPATKEQCDLLFSKMKEAGYKWDVEKKELRKIEQNPAWSEEDEIGFSDALWAIEQARTISKDENGMGNLWYAEKWLKSIKDRVWLQPEQGQTFTKKDVDDAYLKGVCDAKQELEKQCRQESLCDKCRKENAFHSCQDITALGRCAIEHEQKPTNNEKDRQRPIQ